VPSVLSPAPAQPGATPRNPAQQFHPPTQNEPTPTPHTPSPRHPSPSLPSPHQECYTPSSTLEIQGVARCPA
jgi:hypothetical protein